MKMGVVLVGRQLCHKVWALNEEVQINEDGQQIPLEESGYVWQPIGGPGIETVYSKNSTKINISSNVNIPLSTTPLIELIGIMTKTFKHNFIPGEQKNICDWI